MKFLVMARPRHTQQGVTSKMVQETREIVNGYVKSGINDCAFSFADGNGGGLGIVNADSGEKLMELLMASPVAAFSEFQTYPLADFDSSIGKTIEAMKKQGL
jgi:hypothetical protein